MSGHRVIDLFAGACGGWSLGLHRAGYRTVAAAESEPWRRAAFLHNFPGVEMFEDVRLVTARSVRDRLGFLPDVVVGSPPCQDASAANHRGQGVDGARTGLFFDAVRIVAECRPLWAAFENSPRLRTGGVDRLCAELEAAGYACWPFVVGADNVLAPHIRKRMWLIAADTDRIERRPGASGANGSQAGRRAAQHPDADRGGQSRLPQHGQVAGLLDLPAIGGDSDRQGLPLGQGQRGDPCEKLQALERAVGPLGIRWNDGPAGSFRVADGLPAGLARGCISAYGDAVLPQITEAIGRVMARLVPWAAAA